jgi:hypothetical protein
MDLHRTRRAGGISSINGVSGQVLSVSSRSVEGESVEVGKDKGVV